MLRRSILALAIPATTMLIACGGGTGLSRNSTDVTAGMLAVAPSTLDFGNVTVGKTKTMTGTLTANTADITVSTAAWNGEGYSVSGITFPATIAAGQSVSFAVTFVPQSSGSSNGSISFVSNASNSPSTETLTGAGTQASEHSVDLSWNPSTSRIVGYNIYRGTHSRGPYSRLNSSPQAGTTYVDERVQSGLTYFYVVKSVDLDSRESSPSNEAKAVIPF